MKISQAIQELQDVLKQFGDKDVKVCRNSVYHKLNDIAVCGPDEDCVLHF